MRSSLVSFFSEGCRLGGLWRVPDGGGPFPVVVQGPGWLGLKDAKLYERYHRAFTDAGFAVLVFDYRGFGDSGGPRDRIDPAGQLADLVNAVSYVTTREDVVSDAVGVFGTGGTGGGNAVLLAEADRRVKVAISQVPVADGADWLHRMRSEYEWLAFLEALEVDRRLRVTTGVGRLVAPREEIMVPTAERRATTIKADVDDRVPGLVSLASAEAIIGYRPIDAARRLTTPLMVVGVEGDATTPTDHATALFEAAAGPKTLVMQRHTTHYAAYDRYWRQVTPRMVAWLTRYLRGCDVVVREENMPSGTTGKDGCGQ